MKHPDGEQTSPGLAAARRALTARKGPADEADRPPRKPVTPKVLEGQFDLDSHEHGRGK